MSWQEFVIKITGEVLDWPLFGLIAALMFRGPIRAAIGRLKSYEGIGGTLAFGEQLAEVEEEVGTLAADESEEQFTEPSLERDKGTPSDMEGERSWLLAQHAPSGAVIQAWSDLERSLDALFNINGLANESRADSPQRIALADRLTPVNMLMRMVERRILPGTLLKPVNELRQLRNLVAHGRHTPSPGEALTYVETASQVRDILENLATLHEKDATNG